MTAPRKAQLQEMERYMLLSLIWAGRALFSVAVCAVEMDSMM